MRVKCANCGMIYDIPVSNMEFRDESNILASGICPSCKSNAKDRLDKTEFMNTNHWRLKALQKEQ